MTNVFWNLWEHLIEEYPDIANDYCQDDEHNFIMFRNEINCKSNQEIAELIEEIASKIKVLTY